MFGQLWSDAGDQAGIGMGQTIRLWFKINNQGFIDRLEIIIGTDAGKLNRPVAPGIRTGGFVVMPIKTLISHSLLTEAATELKPALLKDRYG